MVVQYTIHTSDDKENFGLYVKTHPPELPLFDSFFIFFELEAGLAEIHMEAPREKISWLYCFTSWCERLLWYTACVTLYRELIPLQCVYIQAAATLQQLWFQVFVGGTEADTFAQNAMSLTAQEDMKCVVHAEVSQVAVIIHMISWRKKGCWGSQLFQYALSYLYTT